jgi:hypothetical protein
MDKYTIAYKNDKTVEHAERTGKLGNGWVRVYAWVDLQDAYTVFDRMCKEGRFKGSILGVFLSHENDKVDWFDRPPRIAKDSRDKLEWRFSALRGLINSRSSADL